MRRFRVCDILTDHLVVLFCPGVRKSVSSIDELLSGLVKDHVTHVNSMQTDTTCVGLFQTKITYMRACVIDERLYQS